MERATVLIVDDERHITHLVSRKLEQSGFVVHVANAARRALELAFQYAPEVVVTDFQMPGMSGLELAFALFEDPRTQRTPVLMVTARGHKVPKDQLMRTNIRAMMMKPFGPTELVQRVHELIVEAAADAGSAAA